MTKSDDKVPALRFKGFTDEWEQRKLKNITKRISRKNLNLDSTLPLTISAQYGLVDQRKFFDKQIASKKLENYLLLKNGEFAYNKSYSKDYPFGAIKRLNNYKLGVLSTLYIAFKPVSINTDYLEEYFDSTKWSKEIYKRATEGARNHGLLNISPQDFFELNLSIPNNRIEQERISKILKLLSLLITLQQRKEKQIKLLKQAMFQTLFTNKNVPQLRFKGFTDNWEQRKLGDLTQRIKSYPISHDAEINKITGTKYIHYGDIHTGKLKRITNEKILPNINDNNYIPLKSGDVIVADASEDYKGIADACVIDLMKEHYKIVSGLHTIVFRPNEKLKSDFLYTYLHTSIFKHYGYRVGTGLKVFGISYNNLSNMKIKLPKIDEQNKVDKIINIVTNLVTLQQNKTKKLENLKQFLLQNMFI